MLLSRDIHLILLRISAFIGVVCLSAGSTLRSLVSDEWKVPVVIGVIILAAVLSSVVPGWVVQVLSRWRWYRRWIMGETWIEGAWLLASRREVKPTEVGPQRRRIGVVTYSYPGQYLSLNTNGHHFDFTDLTGASIDKSDDNIFEAHGKFWRQEPLIQAKSKLAFMDAALTYINVFNYDGESGEGIAIGWFTRDQGRYPEAFTAKIMTKSGDIFHQSGWKLDDGLVDALQKKYSFDWKRTLIRHRFVHGDRWRSRLPDILPGWKIPSSA